MLRISSSYTATLLCIVASSLSAQGVDSVEVTPHEVTRPVTQNTGTGVGACQQFMPWAYDANGGRVRQQLTYVWSVSNAADFDVDTITGGVCARQAQLSDTVTTVVTATIVAEGKSGTSSFTVTPDPALALASPPPVSLPAGPGTRTPVPTTNPVGPGDVAAPAGASGTQRQTNTTPAPSPTQVTVSAISPTTLQISWSGVAGASGYYLYRSASAGGSFTGISTALIQGNLTTDPTLTPNTTAYYKVATIVPNMSPGYSAAVAGTTMSPAPGPANLKAEPAGYHGVKLTWSAAPGAQGYNVLRGNPTRPATDLNPPSGCYGQTTLLEENLAAGRYMYSVQSCPKGGTSTVYVNVGRPQGLRSKVARGSSWVYLFWTGTEYATSGRILRGPTAAGPFTELGGVVGNFYAGDGLDKKGEIGKTNYYKVEATYPGNAIEETASLAVTIPERYKGITDLKGSSPGTGTVDLTWTCDPAAIGYRVSRGSPTNWLGPQFTQCSFTDTALAGGATHSYFVFANYPEDVSMSQSIEVKVAP